MMKLKFDPNLSFQRDAVNAVVALFRGQMPSLRTHLFQVFPNTITLGNDQLFENLREVQQRNHIDTPSQELGEKPFNFTIEMETGTGKTYVYLRTILELCQQYGFTKFIIVAPSVAIKEGVLKMLDITREHFRDIYRAVPYSYYVYGSKNLEHVRRFAHDTSLQIMILTKDAFNKIENIINKVQDRMGDRPIELIKQTRPIVILDEPQKMGGEATTWGISELNPLFVLRYSATHRETPNLVYVLTPYDAYEQGLVKKIEVLSVTEDADPSSRKIILRQVLTSPLRAKVKVFVKEKAGVKFKEVTLREDDDLERKTSNPYYKSFVVSEIRYDPNFIAFANGVKILEGEISGGEDPVTRTMIKETILEHLEKKAKWNSRGVKVLSLFFINHVGDYLPEGGWLRKMFEEEFINILKTPAFASAPKLEVKKVHKGYFSQMRTASSIEKDEAAYNLIMRDKEKLLSLGEPVEFIFSHSALREGWDNPNVFNICTLSYSTSKIKKRQEIGRGLRLVVDSDGSRLYDKEVNVLTVITNETYRDYVEQLQTEFREEVGLNAPPVENKRTRKTLVFKKELLNDGSFMELWQKISPKARYVVNLDADEFIRKCVKEINAVEIGGLKVRIERERLEMKQTKTGGEITGEKRGGRSEGVQLTCFPNAVNYIEAETKLTRTTILKILQGAENLKLFFGNPQKYLELVVQIIKACLHGALVDGIGYVELNESEDVNRFNEEIDTYEKYVVPLDNAKTVYTVAGTGKTGVKIDPGPGAEGISHVEKEFARGLDADSRVKLFIKLPDWYSIATPAGNYTPDWAAVVETDTEKKYSIYFVVETKGTRDPHKLREEEQNKIKCARKRFENLKEVHFEAPVENYEHFEEKVEKQVERERCDDC